MANAKISDDSVFDPKQNVRLISGLAGYDSSGNAKISGQDLVESVINSNDSGTPSTAADSRVTFYGVNGDNLGGSGGFIWQNNTYTLNIGAGGMGSGLNGGLVISGNYIAGNEQPKVTFKFGATPNPPEEFIITTSSSGVGQTLILPSTLPSTGQYLKVNGVSNVDNVALSWDTPTNDNTTYTLGTKANVNVGEIELTDSISGSTPDTVTLTGAGGTTVTSTTSGVTITSLTPSSPGGNSQSVQYNASGTFSGDSGFTYQLQNTAGDIKNRLLLGDVGSSKGEVNIYGGATESGMISLIAPSDEGVILTVPTAPNDSYTITLPGDTPTNNQILESNSSGTLSWINTPSSGGGLDAFNSLTVNTTTRDADWNYSTDGVNVKLTPLDPTTATPATRTKITVSGTWPNGAEGYLLVDSTNSNNFELPANSLIENGLPQAFSSGLTKYHFVYDGTNYLWSRENAMVAPTYLPAAGVVTDNLVGFYDPATFTQYTFNSTYSVNVVNNLSTWTNSENIPSPVGNLTAYVDETDPQYDNYMGFISATSTDPAYFDFRPDQAFGSDDKYFTSTISPSIGTTGPDVAEWSAIMWIKPSSSIPITDMWMVDVYNGTTYDEGLKIKDKRLGFYQGSSSVGTPDYTNFPALNASNVGDDWMFVAVTITATSSANAQARVYIGNPATFAASSSTIVGYDGSDININALGIYKFEFAAEVFDTDPLTSIFIGSNATSSASGSSKPLYDVGLGEVGFWKKALSDTEVDQMWLATKDTYNIV